MRSVVRSNPADSTNLVDALLSNGGGDSAGPLVA
jgi:hypothetical protein